MAANPSEPGKISWKALQKYADGSVVEWVGPQNAEEPASVTTIAKGDQAAPHGDHHATKDESAAENNSDSDTPSNDSDTSVNWLPIVLASVAILLSLISLFRKKNILSFKIDVSPIAALIESNCKKKRYSPIRHAQVHVGCFFICCMLSIINAIFLCTRRQASLVKMIGYQKRGISSQLWLKL
ncbi:hypothetical protein RWE15_00585 [Virgibacillus halophilus]|uniref:YcnI-like domain-containing protein n=1 Tax=Tigheibacillus halophilus TaxID=361280 RepID=A0ABU5C399_9BACI|nr:hypothetical protein [Virgibacillus halophilus]